MAKKTGDYNIPFDENGNQLDWADAKSNWPRDAVWLPNEEFDDVLTYIGYGRGRSSATLNFRRRNGTTVSVFLSNAHEMIPVMVNGEIAGRFTFVKKGQNYGCRYLAQNAAMFMKRWDEGENT